MRGWIRRRSTFSTPASRRSCRIWRRCARTTIAWRDARAARSVGERGSAELARQDAGEQRRAGADAEGARVVGDRLVAGLGVGDVGLALEADGGEAGEARCLVLEGDAGVGAAGHGARGVLDVDAIGAQLIALLGRELVELLGRGDARALGGAAGGADGPGEPTEPGGPPQGDERDERNEPRRALHRGRA